MEGAEEGEEGEDSFLAFFFKRKLQRKHVQKMIVGKKKMWYYYISIIKINFEGN